MEAKESKIIDILTENKKYIIPAYQRPYSWDQEQAEQLIKDIHESFVEENTEYFIGSLICIDRGNDEYEVVDGQQRLTTLSLILAKTRNLICNEKVKSNLQQRILPVDSFSDELEEPRLKIRKKEEDLYKNYILQDDVSYLPKENDRTYTQNLFISNFAVIGDYLNNEVGTEDTLVRLVEYILKNVYVVLVKTESFASSYRLFNVLNTRGLSLKQSDLLKNRLFEIAEEKNTDKAEEYWEEIEELIGIEYMDDFLIIHEISRKTNRNKAVAVSKIAEHFSEKIESDYDENVIKFLLELRTSAENYRKIKEVHFDDVIVRRILHCLSELYSEWIPPMLAFLNKAEKDIKNKTKLSLEYFPEFVTIFEKCYLHRWFAKLSKSQREVVCYDAVANINSGLTFDEIKEKLKKHANNALFVDYLNSNIYEPRSNRMILVKYLLLRIDQEMQDTSVSKIYNEKITIEHILPQSMQDTYWQERFMKEEHEKWLNKLGNLTLISGYKNTKARNYGFDKKIEVYENKNKTVSFDIAKDILRYEEWNLDTLKERHERLSELAKRIWYVN